MVQFYVFILFCFGSGACVHENPDNVLFIGITKNNIDIKNQLIITAKKVTVEIYVYKMFPVKSHDDVTLDHLVCYDSKSHHKIFSILNFSYVIQHSTLANEQYVYKTTHKLRTLRHSNGTWQWFCKLYAHWEGFNKIYECKVNVKIKDKNETDEYTDTRKQENTPAELRTFPSINRTEHTSEPKPDQKCKNQKPTETNDGIYRGVEANSTLKNVNDSSSKAVNSETPITIWVTFIVVSVVIFIVGLVIGVTCRRFPAPEPEPEPTEQTDELTDEHIYEEVVDKGFKNYTPRPVPEKAVHIYNTPYDHTPWFKKNGRKKRHQSITEKKHLVSMET